MGDASENPRAGHTLEGRWRLEAPLGGGAFGSVWRAVDVEDGGAVAVKVLHREHAANPKILARFVQEAQIQAELAHPAIVPVTAWSEHPVPFLVMPLIDGESLHERCVARAAANAPLPLAAVTWLVEQLCGAVAAAHDRNIIHRDLKPRNVLVNRPGQRPFVRILDFGVAKVLEGSQLSHTTVGRVMGSVLYLAPEQVTGGLPTGRAVDQFALASMFFELLTLRRAWARDTDGSPLPFDVPVGTRGDNHQMSVLRRIVRGPRPSVLAHRPEAGPLVDETLRRALDPSPSDRFEDVRAFAEVLRAALIERSAMAGSERNALSLEAASGLPLSAPGVLGRTEEEEAAENPWPLLEPPARPSGRGDEAGSTAELTVELGPVPPGRRLFLRLAHREEDEEETG